MPPSPGGYRNVAHLLVDHPHRFQNIVQGARGFLSADYAGIHFHNAVAHASTASATAF
jgi:hypothetical protein